MLEAPLHDPGDENVRLGDSFEADPSSFAVMASQMGLQGAVAKQDGAPMARRAGC